MVIDTKKGFNSFLLTQLLTNKTYTNLDVEGIRKEYIEWVTERVTKATSGLLISNDEFMEILLATNKLRKGEYSSLSKDEMKMVLNAKIFRYDEHTENLDVDLTNELLDEVLSLENVFVTDEPVHVGSVDITSFPSIAIERIPRKFVEEQKDALIFSSRAEFKTHDKKEFLAKFDEYDSVYISSMIVNRVVDGDTKEHISYQTAYCYQENPIMST